MFKKLFAGIMLLLMPKPKIIVDPYRPQEPTESTSEYYNRVPLIHRPTAEPVKLTYRGKPVR